MHYIEAAGLLHDSGEKIQLAGLNGKTIAIMYWDTGFNGWAEFCRVDEHGEVPEIAERDLLDL